MTDVSVRPQIPSAEPIVTTLRRLYAEHADAGAIADGSGSLTYRELERRAEAVAAGLTVLGSKPGDRIVLISPNSAAWVEIDHGSYLGGFVRVGLLPRLHPKELAEIVEDTDASVLLVERAWLETAGTDWIPAGIQRVVTIGGEPLPGTTSYEDLVETGLATGRWTTAPDPNSDVWIIYTSGSTGKPKGVRLTARGIGAMVRNVREALPELRSDDVAMHTAPFGHFSGVVGLAVWLVGGTNIARPSFELDEVIDSLNKQEITILPLVPTQINMLTDEILRRRAAGETVDTSCLRWICYAGSAIAPDRLARAKSVFGNVLVQFYGASEAPLPLTTLRPEHHVEEVSELGGLPRLASAGVPNRFTELKVVDDEGNAVEPGTPGEIVVRGEQVMPGYWRNPEATREVLSDDGWLRTGDIGYQDENGFLFIVDRRKDMIVSGGFNVYPREVENVLSTLEGVREVAVVGAPSERWGEEITAIVSVQPGASLGEAEVIDFARASIAGYKVPKRVLFVDDLPKSGTGKILKRVIADQLWAGRGRRV